MGRGGAWWGVEWPGGAWWGGAARSQTCGTLLLLFVVAETELLPRNIFFAVGAMCSQTRVAEAEVNYRAEQREFIAVCYRRMGYVISP